MPDRERTLPKRASTGAISSREMSDSLAHGISSAPTQNETKLSRRRGPVPAIGAVATALTLFVSAAFVGQHISHDAARRNAPIEARAGKMLGQIIQPELDRLGRAFLAALRTNKWISESKQGGFVVIQDPLASEVVMGTSKQFPDGDPKKTIFALIFTKDFKNQFNFVAPPGDSMVVDDQTFAGPVLGDAASYFPNGNYWERFDTNILDESTAKRVQAAENVVRAAQAQQSSIDF